MTLTDMLSLQLAAERLLALEWAEPDEALMRWSAKLVVPAATVDDPDLVEDLELPDGVELAPSTDLVVASAALFAVDLYSPDLYDALDAAGADESEFHDVAHAGRDGNIDVWCGGGSKLLVLDKVTVPEPWRGRWLGPMVATAALAELIGLAGVVACFPAPFELERSDPRRAAEQARLERMWSLVGFDPYKGGVWVLDTDGAETLDATLSSLLAGPQP